MPGRNCASASGDSPRLAEGARPVALREHVGLADQPAQGLEILRLAQIKMGRELAVAGIVFLVADIRQVRRGDLQDVGAVLGEGAGTGRPGEDPRQVEHPHARQRPIAVGELFRRAVADLDDLHQRQRGDRGGLRVLGPFGHGAHHAPGALRGDDRLLEFERVPLRHRLAHRLAIFRHAEHAEGGGTMVREIAVEIAPAAVLGRIDAHHRVALGRHGRPVHLHITPAAERGGRLAGIDRDLLATPGAQFPQIGDGEADRRERGGTGLADAERRRQDRIGTAGDLDRTGAFLGPAGDRQQRAQSIIGHSQDS